MITESQARALAVMLHEIRPRWSIPSMMKVLERNAGHRAPFADTALAAINAARDPAVDTPGGIFTDPRFWPETAKAHLPRSAPCPDHIGEASHNCRCCHADVKAGIRPADMIGKHHTPESEDAE